MNDDEFNRYKSTHFDELAKNLDRVCVHRLKEIHRYLSNEVLPYPPVHTVTLARAIHVLAMRILANEHPAKNLSSESRASKGRHDLHRYWVAVFRLNDGVNGEVQKGALRLRDRLTGFPIQEWHMPSKTEFLEWERAAIFPNDDRQAAARRAVEIMDTFKWGLLAPHFDFGIVVSLAELDTWAASLGIVGTGGITELLRAVEAESAERARITAAAIEAEERGEAFNYEQWLADTPTDAHTQQEAPAKQNDKTGKHWTESAREIADECFDNDTNGNPPTRDCLIRYSKNKRDVIGGYALRVMEIMQARNIHGPRGLIDNAATIAREALQGDKWWGKKAK